MTAVSFDISMSLDGDIAAPNRRPEEPLGDNGERLHEWAFSSDAVGREVLARGGESTLAMICGRRIYDDSIRWWGADGPTGPARLPVFVVSHDAPADVPEGGVYRFVSGGIGEALAEAKAAAGEKNVSVMGGARAYVNFLMDEGDAGVRAAYPEPTRSRLAAIKRRYDPTNVFRQNQKEHSARGRRTVKLSRTLAQRSESLPRSNGRRSRCAG